MDYPWAAVPPPSFPSPSSHAPWHTAVFPLSLVEPWNWIPRLLCIWEKGRQQEWMGENSHLCLAGSTFTTLPHVILKDFSLLASGRHFEEGWGRLLERDLSGHAALCDKQLKYYLLLLSCRSKVTSSYRTQLTSAVCFTSLTDSSSRWIWLSSGILRPVIW
jgi:hypothetical protein